MCSKCILSNIYKPIDIAIIFRLSNNELYEYTKDKYKGDEAQHSRYDDSLRGQRALILNKPHKKNQTTTSHNIGFDFPDNSITPILRKSACAVFKYSSKEKGDKARSNDEHYDIDCGSTLTFDKGKDKWCVRVSNNTYTLIDNLKVYNVNGELTTKNSKGATYVVYLPMERAYTVNNDEDKKSRIFEDS